MKATEVGKLTMYFVFCGKGGGFFLLLLLLLNFTVSMANLANELNLSSTNTSDSCAYQKTRNIKSHFYQMGTICKKKKKLKKN